MRLWLFSEDLNASQARSYPRRGGEVLNDMAVMDAIIAFHRARPGEAPSSDPYPPDFPTPRVRFSDERLWDLNLVNNRQFVSARLRDAMALPEQAAQLLPVDNVSRTPKASAANYWFLHPLAVAAAIDAERSDCVVERCTSTQTGMPYTVYHALTGICFRSDFVPPADLFQDEVADTLLFATDALAERVLAAGCTGVQFRHPLWFAPGYDWVVKTSDGAARTVWDPAGDDYRLEPLTLDEADRGPT